MTYERFFQRLEICGGCTGPRDKMQCRFALVCAYVEKLARKGVIKSSKDFCYPTTGSDLMFNTNGGCLSGAVAITRPAIEIPSGIRSCNLD
ncbi:hypothetical protein [Desulfosporosinus sp.]|uniref:hypothetical protein n=1 Tax=Desulfosporosinus sp. TaxID=157907 RepID=UPI0025C4604D|nr:hypothetical protein [Desulfosporosinus sp.]MBC2723513.1 hypothetical protein [Desulfosporosinus sp.]MBC2728646.1 hypothetical protein [Desulfosporosinus sp.]